MAGPRKTAKPASRPVAEVRQRLQMSPLAEIAKRFRLAAVALDLSETELFERLIELNFPSLHVQNMGKSPFFGTGSLVQGGGAPPPPPQMPSGPSHAAAMMPTVVDDDDDEPSDAASLMSTLPTPSPGSGFMKRSKLVTDSYVRHSAPRDAAIDALVSEN